MVVSICVDLKLIPVERVKFCGVKPFSLPMHGFNIYPLFYRLFIYFLLFLSLISPRVVCFELSNDYSASGIGIPGRNPELVWNSISTLTIILSVIDLCLSLYSVSITSFELREELGKVNLFFSYYFFGSLVLGLRPLLHRNFLLFVCLHIFRSWCSRAERWKFTNSAKRSPARLVMN